MHVGNEWSDILSKSFQGRKKPQYFFCLFQIRDSKTKKAIAETSIRLKELMTAEDMLLEKKFPLKSAEHGSSLYMTLVLRVSDSVGTAPSTPPPPHAHRPTTFKIAKPVQCPFMG